MSISKTDKVDLISKKKTGEYELIIVADEPWVVNRLQKEYLQEKVNNYCNYFLDGQMAEEYPDCHQKRITVRISSSSEIPEYAMMFISQLAGAFNKYGLDIITEVVVPD